MNVHSAAYPAGAARSQLVSPSDFSAHLTLYATSASEIPATTNVTAAGTRGNLTVVLDITPASICYAISNITANVTALNAGHIHMGGANESGPVIIPLFAGAYNATGCASFNESSTLFQLLENPEMFYFNVHNPDYPAGFAR